MDLTEVACLHHLADGHDPKDPEGEGDCGQEHHCPKEGQGRACNPTPDTQHGVGNKQLSHPPKCSRLIEPRALHKHLYVSKESHPMRHSVEAGLSVQQAVGLAMLLALKVAGDGRR